MHARDQSSIFSTGRKFRSDYGLLLQLHTLTLVARSYAFLLQLWRKSCLISGFAPWQVVSNVQNKICNRKPRLKAILGVAREQLKVLHTVEAL